VAALVLPAGATQALATDDAGTVASAAKKKGTKIAVEKTEFGKALVNGAGKAVYLFDIEESTTPECYDDCAIAWPPVITNGKPVAGKGIKGGKLGTTKRTDGSTQVTFAGHPIYYYEHDTRDKILCQNVVEFGGRWLLVKPSGGALR
jgi:predicted lipoprotein with Yx(FWY)xxD motif